MLILLVCVVVLMLILVQFIGESLLHWESLSLIHIVSFFSFELLAHLITLDDKLVDMGYELFDAGQIVSGKLLNVIVAGAVHIIRRILVHRGCIELLGVIKGDNFISTPVNYINGTVNVFDAVYVGKIVKGKGPAQIEKHPEDTQDTRM